MFDDVRLQMFFWILVASMLFFLISTVFGLGDGDGASLEGTEAGHDHGLSWNVFSLRNLFLFGIGFGAVGFLSMQMGYGMATSVSGGAAAGVLIAGVGMWFFRLIASQESNTITVPEALIGRDANVTTAIPAHGLGEIMATNEHGTHVSLYAQSDGAAIASGARVVIIAAAGGRVTVRPE